MSRRKSLPLWGQWAAGLVLMSTAVSAGALSLAVNITYGLGAGLAAAIAYGLSDAAKLSLPVVAAGIGWSRQMRLAAIAAAVVSIWCAANYFADTEGARLLAARHGETVYADQARQIAELEARLAAAQAAAEDERKSGGCGRRCKAHLDHARLISAELSAARARRAQMHPVEASGLAAMLAAATGWPKQRLSRLIVTTRALAALLLVELLAHLGGAAAKMLGAAITATAKARAAKPRAKPKREVKPKQAKPRLGPAAITHQPVLVLPGMAGRRIPQMSPANDT